MQFLIILFMVVALAIGVYVGLGAPGLRKQDYRVVKPGRARRLQARHIHWIRPDRSRR